MTHGQNVVWTKLASRERFLALSIGKWLSQLAQFRSIPMPILQVIHLFLGRILGCNAELWLLTLRGQADPRSLLLARHVRRINLIFTI